MILKLTPKLLEDTWKEEDMSGVLKNEINWLNSYHQEVFDKIVPYLME